MSTPLVQVFVEDLPELRIAGALLRPYPVKLVDGRTCSNAIGLAKLSLLEEPEQPIALLLDAPGGDREAEETRAAVMRILGRTAADGWYVAVAVPRLDAWAMTDSRIRQDLESYCDGQADYHERAARIARLTKNQPFDPTGLCRTNPDFKGLIEFIQQHTSDTSPRTQRSARR
jgi:hypothetical protein